MKRVSQSFAFVAAALSLLLSACSSTPEGYCESNAECSGGEVCDVPSNRCVALMTDQDMAPPVQDMGSMEEDMSAPVDMNAPEDMTPNEEDMGADMNVEEDMATCAEGTLDCPCGVGCEQGLECDASSMTCVVASPPTTVSATCPVDRRMCDSQGTSCACVTPVSSFTPSPNGTMKDATTKSVRAWVPILPSGAPMASPDGMRRVRAR